MAVSTSYLLIFDVGVGKALVFGVYRTRSEAKMALFKLLPTQKIFPNLVKKYAREHRIDISKMSGEDLYKLSKETDFEDFLQHTVGYNIDKVRKSELFYFPNYFGWDEENLYRAIQMTLEGEYGELEEEREDLVQYDFRV